MPARRPRDATYASSSSRVSASASPSQSWGVPLRRQPIAGTATRARRAGNSREVRDELIQPPAGAAGSAETSR
jgi:hypothetical protein